MRFAELSDEQWEFIKPHIPPQSIVGRKRADDRKTINGILYVLITGCCWHDMPRCYVAYQTAWRRLKRWSKEGVWNRILAAAQEQAYAIGKLSLETVAVDKHAHRFKKGGESVRYNGHKRRKGVKAHVAVSSKSLPLVIIVGAGNEHDSRRFEQVVSNVGINIGR